MYTTRETPDISKRSIPTSKLRTIIDWLIETDRRFRMCQDRIDRLSDRF